MKSYPSTYPSHITCCIWAWYGLEAALERAWPTLPWILSGFEGELFWLLRGLKLTLLLSEASDTDIFTMVPFPPGPSGPLEPQIKTPLRIRFFLLSLKTVLNTFEAHSRILLSSLLSNKKLPKAHSSHRLLPGLSVIWVLWETARPLLFNRGTRRYCLDAA